MAFTYRNVVQRALSYTEMDENLQTVETLHDETLTARDAAVLNAGIYATTAAGLAATTNGEYFSVPNEADDGYLDLYKNNAGSAVLTKTYYSMPTAALDEIGTYETLRAYTGVKSAMYVRGRASLFDGGHGVFRRDDSDTTSADNGGTVLVDTSSRRWKREFSGDYQAVWWPVKADGVTDDTSAAQDAIDAAFAANADIYFAPGSSAYLVTGLKLPGRVSGGTDDRGKAIRIYGQGTGEPFVVSAPKGTWFKSVTDAPVLEDYLDGASNSNGQVTIDHIRFDGTSTTPVVRLQSFYGLSTIHDCVIYQRGTGDGLTLGWGATVNVRDCYVLNKDWATAGLGAARTGTGISYAPTANNGLVTITKCTSRGWLTGYNIGGGGGTAYSATIEKSECSVVRNGIVMQSTADKCTVDRCYLEGGDGGVGITNDGDYNSITGNLVFAGFATGIKDTSTSNKGSSITENVIGLAATVNAVGVDVTSSAAFGGYNKSVTQNSISYTLGTAGVIGLRINGTDPRVDHFGNSFDPRGNWTGAGSAKISDLSTNGVYGFTTAQSGEAEIPVLSRGAIILQRIVTALTESDVSANILTVPAGSYFAVTASAPATVQRINSGVASGRFLVLRTTNANMTFTDTAYLQTAGGVSFTGPGVITFIVERVGADNFAYEVARTVF